MNAILNAERRQEKIESRARTGKAGRIAMRMSDTAQSRSDRAGRKTARNKARYSGRQFKADIRKPGIGKFDVMSTFHWRDYA